jgi:hypothetical protein
MMIYTGYVHLMAAHEINKFGSVLGSFSASVRPPYSMLGFDYSLQSKQ